MAFSNHTVVDEHNGHAPVVQGMKSVVGIDITQLRLDAKRADGGQSVIAEMTALARDQDDFHAPRLMDHR